LIQLLLWVDSQYHVTQKAQDMSVEFIKLGIQADERYHLHEFVTEGIYMVIVAGLKAAVAFKETPRHKDDQIIIPQIPIRTPSSKEDKPAAKNASWVWTPW
jgi:hypothetical protein